MAAQEKGGTHEKTDVDRCNPRPRRLLRPGARLLGPWARRLELRGSVLALRPRFQRARLAGRQAMMGNCDFSSLHGWSGWLGHSAWVLFLVLGAAFAVWCLARRGRCGNPAADRLDSLEILKSRLARGDITIEEYNTLKGVL